MLSDLFISELRINKEAFNDEESYIFSLPVVKNTESIRFTKKITFFVGENGSGKSTLLEAIAVNYGFNAEGGSRNFNFSTCATHSPLYKYLTLSKGFKRARDGFFLRAESFYNVASEVDRLNDITFMLGAYGGKSLHNQSHGESFLSLVLNRFGGNGLYILDEPEAALSPSSQFMLLSRINQLVNDNSQFIIATHSPILMAFPDAEINAISADGIKATPYKETEHYILTKQFLDNPQRMFRYLME